MNVKELIEELETLSPEAEVHFVYNYGDHSRTDVAPKAEHVEEGYVKHSAYHDMDQVLDEDGDDHPSDDPKAKLVVLIRS